MTAATPQDGGLPKDSVLRYETAVKADNFLIIVHGGPADTLRAREVLAQAGGTDVEGHAAAA